MKTVIIRQTTMMTTSLKKCIRMYKDSLFLMTGRHVFKIPKSFVEGFNGSEVLLNVPGAEVLNLLT